MTKSIAHRQRLEHAIVSRVVIDAIKAGYTLRVDNGGDELSEPFTDAKSALAAMFATDDEHLFLYRNRIARGWVYFVYGNDGWDVINDYTVNLEPVLAGANRVANRLEEMFA